MIKHFKSLIGLAIVLLAFLPATAQTVLTPTTLSAAITDSSTQAMTVTSATGFTASTTVAYIDTELVGVKSVNSTVIGIIRGIGGTHATAHASGALVFVGSPNSFQSKLSTDPAGACTRSKLLFLPVINVRSGAISDCIGGQYVQGVRTSAPKWRVYAPEPGGTAYTALNTNGTTVGATTVYCTEVNLPHNKLLTGIALLNGTTVTTDSQYVTLYDSTGVAIANSALAGTKTAGASGYQERAFTSKFYAVGPAQYFACFQSDTGTDTVRMAITAVNDNILTKGQTGATYGTIPTLTVPTSFTTAVGPYVYLY